MTYIDGPPPMILTGADVVTVGTAAAWATFDYAGRHRYLLGRLWDVLSPRLIVGMINPSSAGVENDPTVRRVIGFARRDYFGGILIWNACSLISTDPKGLKNNPNRIGPRNDEAIMGSIEYPALSRCVFACGNPPDSTVGEDLGRAWDMVAEHRQLWQFGTPTKQGWPRHPVRLAGNTPMIEITPRVDAVKQTGIRK